jgi:hypothetical protein
LHVLLLLVANGTLLLGAGMPLLHVAGASLLLLLLLLLPQRLCQRSHAAQLWLQSRHGLDWRPCSQRCLLARAGRRQHGQHLTAHLRADSPQACLPLLCCQQLSRQALILLLQQQVDEQHRCDTRRGSALVCHKVRLCFCVGGVAAAHQQTDKQV